MCRLLSPSLSFSFFFFNDTATTEIYTLSLHDALPISMATLTLKRSFLTFGTRAPGPPTRPPTTSVGNARSEEHTSELQSHLNLVCRLLLEKKKTQQYKYLPTAIERGTAHTAH